MLWGSAKQNKRIMEYFPILEENELPDRAFLINSLNTMFLGQMEVTCKVLIHRKINMNSNKIPLILKKQWNF